MHSDPLSDMLARIRNAQNARHKTTRSPSSRLKEQVLEVLKREGYIKHYRVEEARRNVRALIIELKYDNGRGVIRKMARVSKPGRRVYAGASGLGRYYNGLGIAILSTPQGVLADHEARRRRVGGEVLCTVF